MTRRARIRALLVAALITTTLVTGLFYVFYLQDGGPLRDLKNEGVSTGYLPVGIVVFGRSSETISARLSFLSPDGRVIGVLERSWPGWEMWLDCVVLKTDSGFLVYPFSVGTDKTKIGRGINLLRYYMRENLPLLFESPALSDAQRNAFIRLSFLVSSERWLPSLLGRLRHERVLLRTYEAGMDYYLYVNEDGTLEFRPLP